MHWLSKYRADHLSNSRFKLPSKISLGPIIVVSIRPEIPPILRDNFSLPFSLLLVFLDPFVLVNTVYELTHIPYRFLGQ